MNNTSSSKNSVSVHGQWSTRLAFILAAAGAAVGLGNIWKFPYAVGENGGAAFILIYLLCIILIGIPVMLAEIIIGRYSRKNPIDSIHAIAQDSGHQTWWKITSWLGLTALLLILSFYSVVAGWIIAYMFYALRGVFNGLDTAGVNQVWSDLMSDPVTMLFWSAIYLIMTLWVVARGVHKGIEKTNNLIMPLLLVMLLVLVGYGTSTGYFTDAVKFMFAVDWSKITGTVIIDAMGQAFFTLAVGVCVMLVYGSYLSQQSKVVDTVFVVAGLDIVIALLAGLAIFPIAFAHDLSLTAGPGLMFQVLPVAFAQMGAGQLFASLFFMLLIFAAWSSTISMGEPLVVTLMEKAGLSRNKAAVLVGVAAWLIGITCVLSFNLWSDIKLFGHWTFFGAITDLVTNILMPLGGLGFVLFASWIMKRSFTEQEMGIGDGWLYRSWRFLARFVAPAGILFIFIAAFW